MEEACGVAPGTYADCMTTTAVLDLLGSQERIEQVSEVILEKVLYHMRQRIADTEVQLECILYDSKYGLLAQSQGAEDMIGEVR